VRSLRSVGSRAPSVHVVTINEAAISLANELRRHCALRLGGKPWFVTVGVWDSDEEQKLIAYVTTRSHTSSVPKTWNGFAVEVKVSGRPRPC